MNLLEWLSQPWPWYVTGPLIGLMVPLLLLAGNKSLGISSSLRHLCAACLPAKVPFFHYNWKAERWNLLFVLGVGLGGVVGWQLLPDPNPIALNPKTVVELGALGVEHNSGYLPASLFSWEALTGWRGWVMLGLGGFLVGFGTRYAGGCTSGHTIMGLSALQWPSLLATIAFFAGGLLMTHLGFQLLF